MHLYRAHFNFSEIEDLQATASSIPRYALQKKPEIRSMERGEDLSFFFKEQLLFCNAACV